jgi:hypothetical protein
MSDPSGIGQFRCASEAISDTVLMKIKPNSGQEPWAP